MKKSPSASPDFPVREFFARFADERACLEHIMSVRFGGTKLDCPSCGTVGVQFHKLSERRVYACPECRFQIAPTANTILHDTRTPLVSWFYAMYLFVATRHGVSGKELQRQLGVTYKTAYRIGIQTRKLMEQADVVGLLGGHVEMDEAYVGGRRSGGKRGRGAPGKAIVMGMKERGGKVAARMIPDIQAKTLRKVVLENVEPGSVVSTDELMSYGLLTGDGFVHGAVKHGAKEWTYYDYRTGETHSTNSIESFWHLFKYSVRSTHIQISREKLPLYLAEFCYRSNHRQFGNLMFDALLAQV